jgi:hypothetical protein
METEFHRLPTQLKFWNFNLFRFSNLKLFGERWAVEIGYVTVGGFSVVDNRIICPSLSSPYLINWNRHLKKQIKEYI